MPRGNPPIEQYEKKIINEAAQGKKKIVVTGTTYYRTTKYIRKTDRAIVLAYYNPHNHNGFRVEIVGGQAKLIVMKPRKQRGKKTEKKVERNIEYPPPERHLKKLMEDPLVRLNYQIILDLIATNLDLPRNGYILTSEDIEIPILAINGGYKTITGLIHDIARLFYPKDDDGEPLRVHYRVKGTFITRSGRIIRGKVSIPDELRLDRQDFDINKYLDFVEEIARRINEPPGKLFIYLMKSYLGISERYLKLLIAGIRRFDVDHIDIIRGYRLSTEKLELAIKASSVGVVLRLGSVEILFLAIDSTKYSRFSSRDPLVLLEEIADIFSGTACEVSVGSRPPLGEVKARFVVLLGDGEYFSEEFIFEALIRGYIPVVRPRRDTPYAERPNPFLVAYTVFFWRYLWWIYRLRVLVERVFAYLSKRGKLLSRSFSSARREILVSALAKNIATCVSLGVLGGILAVSL